MKVVVIGLGSMGKRRLRLLKSNFNFVELVGVDLDEERRKTVKNEFDINTYGSINEAVEEAKPIAAVISTSPLTHSSIALQCLELGLHVFTEINLVSDRYEEIMKIANEKKLELFLSSTQVYRSEVEEIDKVVKKCTEKVNYTYHIGQYLPDWHPWENYKDFFVNDIRTNGCRELFAIELPWIISVFGKINKIYTVKDKISTLDLNYQDSYMCIFEHENGNKGVMCVDIVSRKATTKFEVYGEELHINWDGTPNSLEIMDMNTRKMKQVGTYKEVEKDNRYAENIIENPYLEELAVYLDKIKGNNREKYTFEDDLYTLSLIDEIEGE
jgi:predicted dehydrogenase